MTSYSGFSSSSSGTAADSTILREFPHMRRVIDADLRDEYTYDEDTYRLSQNTHNESDDTVSTVSTRTSDEFGEIPIGFQSEAGSSDKSEHIIRVHMPVTVVSGSISAFDYAHPTGSDCSSFISADGSIPADDGSRDGWTPGTSAPGTPSMGSDACLFHGSSRATASEPSPDLHGAGASCDSEAPSSGPIMRESSVRGWADGTGPIDTTGYLKAGPRSPDLQKKKSSIFNRWF